MKYREFFKKLVTEIPQLNEGLTLSDSFNKTELTLAQRVMLSIISPAVFVFTICWSIVIIIAVSIFLFGKIIYEKITDKLESI